MKCPRCGSEISDSSRFCKICGEAVYCFRDSNEQTGGQNYVQNDHQGTTVDMRCTTCGNYIPSGSKFCEVCGETVGFVGSVGNRVNNQSRCAYSVPAEGIKDYMIFSILVTIFCCVPFGVPAIIYSSRVSKFLAIGDVRGAAYASNKAKVWCICSLIIGIVVKTVYLISMFGNVYSDVFESLAQNSV